MKNKLIIVEGLPSTGKSTTAKYIATELNLKFFDESDDNHPADYIFSAYITKNQLNKFTTKEQNLIISKSLKKDDGYIVPLKEFKDDLFEKLVQYKIYDYLPWNIEKKLFIDKWTEFKNNISDNYVLNCTLLQNSMCETMIRFDFNLQQSYEYIKEIYEIIKPLNPIIIYLKITNIKESINRVLPNRGSEWLNAVVNYHCTGKYGKRNKLKGFDGYIKALEERQNREIYILEKLGINHIIVEDPNANWDETYKKINNYLKKQL